MKLPNTLTELFKFFPKEKTQKVRKKGWCRNQVFSKGKNPKSLQKRLEQ